MEGLTEGSEKRVRVSWSAMVFVAPWKEKSKGVWTFGS